MKAGWRNFSSRGIGVPLALVALVHSRGSLRPLYALTWSVALSIASVINKQAIKQLVDLNFDNVEYYPELWFHRHRRCRRPRTIDAYTRS